MAHRDSLICVSLQDLSQEIVSPISSPSKLLKVFFWKTSWPGYPYFFLEEVDGDPFTLHEVNLFDFQIMQSSYQNANIIIIPQSIEKSGITKSGLFRVKPHKTHTLKKISMKIIELIRTMRFTKSINDVMKIVQNVIQCDNNVYLVSPCESISITQKVRDLFLVRKLKPPSRGFPREYKDAFHVSTVMKREQLLSEESKASQAQSMLQSNKRSHKAESILEDVEDTTEKKLSVRILANVNTLANLTSGVKRSSTKKLLTTFKFEILRAACARGFSLEILTKGES